jgi:acyl transferase domain-containing protein
VLLAGRGAPLVLASSKSWLGHAEPGAGVVGLLHAASMLSQRAAAPVAHLRTLNPYVEAALAGSSSPSSWSLPRQSAGLATLPGSQLGCIGTSAFAFQGTNAHVLLETAAAGSGPASRGRPAALWQRSRFWPLPPAHPLLRRCSGPGLFEVQLDSSLAAFMWDHQVRRACPVRCLLSNCSYNRVQRPLPCQGG